MLLSGCSEPFTSPNNNDLTPTPLYLFMNKPVDVDTDYYVVDYPIQAESSYTSVEYITTPMTRVFWDSEDTFTFIYWGEEITQPIINYSTYSDGVDGSGKQMIYLYQDHIGDTLSVDGCVGLTCERLYFIVRGVWYEMSSL